MLGNNIQYLRQNKNLSQEALAKALGLTRTSLSGYEIGKIEPNIDVLKKISKYFNTSIDSLLNSDLSQNTGVKNIGDDNLRILAVTVDKEENENIEFVPVKAKAGYLNGYGDPEFIKELPRFNIPNRPIGTYRAFEISGDSMLPINHGSIIIGKYIENWQDLKDDLTYVLVTHSDGVIYKRIKNDIETKGKLTLISDNPIYQPFEVYLKDIKEAWGYYAHISFNHPDSQISLSDVMENVRDLQEEVEGLKKTRFKKTNNFGS